MGHYVSIDLASSEEMTDEFRNLASSTGSEEEEIDEMITGDKVFLAKKKGKTIGFIALRSTKKDSHLEISGLAIKQNERRRGIASLLLKHIDEFARDNKAQRLAVKTSNDNIPALTLYQKNGFTIREIRLGTLIEHHGGRETPGWEKIPVRDEIILEKNLSP